MFLYSARRYGEALEELNRALEVDPNHTVSYLYLGKTYEALGKYEEAVRCYLRANELMGIPEGEGPYIAGCYALMGKREEARRILNDVIEYSKGKYFPSVIIAAVFSTLGEKEQVFAWLEKAFRERDANLLWYLKTGPTFDPVRSDPRYAELLQKIGLEK
jgi:tetratricopeptide (TPR) repeat protein